MRNLGLRILLAVTLGSPGAPLFAEQLCFQAQYEGLFSAGERWQIATVVLQQDQPGFAPPGAGEHLTQLGMWVSSAGNPVVEELFPFRLRYRSLVRNDFSATLAQERFKRTDRLQWELAWVDPIADRLVRYRNSASKWRVPGLAFDPAAWLGPTARALRPYDQREWDSHEEMMDRLALLQWVRQLSPTAGEQHRLPVWEGRRLYEYLVTVQGREAVPGSTSGDPAWKVSLDGYRLRDGQPDEAHATVTLWLEDAPARRPLRFEHQHAVGKFVISLHPDQQHQLCSIDFENAEAGFVGG